MEEKVVAREYKVMLRAEQFAGNESQVLNAANAFWDAFTQAINPLDLKTDGSLKKIKDRRIIDFYDTDTLHLLYGNDYIFRVRRDTSTDEREVTLKFRHPDRYIAQDRNMNARDVSQGKTKFEEDIKSPFTVLYSFSTTQTIAATKQLNTLNDVIQLYPDLADKLTSYTGEEPIHIVKHSVREIVIKGGEFQIRKEPKVNAECALIAWYDDNAEKPVVVEFSFRYSDKNGAYTRKMAQRAYEVFEVLQKLTSWLDSKPKTKTAYIYNND
jgi:hypothetical protein